MHEKLFYSEYVKLKKKKTQKHHTKKATANLCVSRAVYYKSQVAL